MRNNIIKFGKARKALARQVKEKKAQENRIKFGRTKTEKKHDDNQRQKFHRHLDDHQREP